MSKLMSLLAHAKPVAPKHSFTEFTSIEYLAIDVANNYGLDKKDFDERIDWTLSYEPQLMKMLAQMEADPTATNAFLEEADEPALFFAGCLALRDAREGKPSGYPISLDAASSGLQILAALSGCRKSAQLCGLVPTGHRADAYQTSYQLMLQRVGGAAQIGRPDLKRAIMTSLYASTAVPREVFGEGELLEAFYATIESAAPGAWQLNKQLQQLWNPEALEHAWTLPDNFHARVKVIDTARASVHFLDCPYEVSYKVNRPMEESRSISPNIVHSVDGFVVREMHRRCTHDPAKILRATKVLTHMLEGGKVGRSRLDETDQLVETLCRRARESGMLSARILEILDYANAGHLGDDLVGMLQRLLLSLPAKSFEIISVHDCFRCHPNYGNDLRRQYNQIMSEIARSEILADIATQVTGLQATCIKSDDIADEILRADYALT